MSSRSMPGPEMLSCAPSRWSSAAPGYRVRSRPRQKWALPSIETRIALAKRSRRGSSSVGHGLPVSSTQTNPSWVEPQAEVGAALAQTLAGPPDRQITQPQPVKRLDRPAGRQHRRAGALDVRLVDLRWKTRRSSCNSESVSAGNAWAKPSWAAMPALVVTESEWSSRDEGQVVDPGPPGHRVVGVGGHQPCQSAV